MAAAGFLPQEVIRRKRDGKRLAAEDLAAFVAGITDGSITEGQSAAFAMAIFFQGLERGECVALTRAMMASGRVLDWSGEERPVLDKHSTGGVGDKVSLPLAAILAACGAAVPMISGRGLGHTGGTLDKLDSIPGYRSQPDIEAFRRAVAEAGCAIIGQTADLAPADKRLYAIRDVTATVESIPLITASILSKKLAAGLQGLIMDVKVGSGAFMAEMEDAKALAESIVAVANGAGLDTRALITDMNQVLGRSAGNALEVREAIDYLTGADRDPRLHDVVVALASELLQIGGLAEGPAAAEAAIAAVLDGGAAAERFQGMVAALGGPGDLVEAPKRHLPEAACQVAAYPEAAGTVTAIDVRAVGLAVLSLGGGRRRADEAIDHSVGLTEVAGLGEVVGPDRPLAIVHARAEDQAEAAAHLLHAAFALGEGPAEAPTVYARIED
ncbi:MAG: thymidine phosphorylase [Kiloniellales bacterium]|nr:thymidine phosphorylase [Kiloniellales bacterium]